MSDLANVPAERALVGALIVSPDQWHDVEFVSPNDFYRLELKEIWTAIGSLVSTGSNVDAITICAELERAGKPQKFTEVQKLTEEPENSYHAVSYAQTVVDMATRRRIHQAASRIVNAAHKLDTPATEVVELVRNEANELETGVSSGKVRKYADLIKDYDDAMAGRVTPVRVFPFQTKELNRIFGGGLVAPRVAIVAGEPKMGKSILLQWIATELGMGGHGCFFVSQEMEDWDLVVRGISAEGKIPEEDLHVLKLDDHHDKYMGAIEKLSSLPIYVSDESSWSMSALRAQMYRLQRENDVNILLIDYLGLLKDNPQKQDEYQQLTWKTQELKRMAKELGIAVLALHTVNATGEQSGGTGPAYRLDLALNLVSDKVYQERYVNPLEKRAPYDNVRWLREVRRRYGKWQPASQLVMHDALPVMSVFDYQTISERKI